MENKEEGRVRKNTSDEKNLRIDQEIVENISKYGRNPQDIDNRIKQLEKEWSIERALEMNMSVVASLGIALAILVNTYWIILPIIVLVFFMQHALQGWCPPLPLFRYFKVRTRQEIDHEKFGLKALRGDFRGEVTSAEEAFGKVRM
jgi:hypothetical protein